LQSVGFAANTSPKPAVKRKFLSNRRRGVGRPRPTCLNSSPKITLWSRFSGVLIRGSDAPAMGDLAHIEVCMTRVTVPADGVTALDARRLTNAVTPGDDALVGSRQLRPHTKVDSHSAAFVGPEAGCTSSVTNVATPNLAWRGHQSTAHLKVQRCRRACVRCWTAIHRPQSHWTRRTSRSTSTAVRPS
jgi:hypothetical protein